MCYNESVEKNNKNNEVANMCELKRMLHVLNVPHREIIKKVPKYAYQGFTDLLISPIQPTKNDDDWWVWLYQPTDIAIGNRLGDAESLKMLADTCHKYGIRLGTDNVLRHLAGADDGSLHFHEKDNQLLLSKRDYVFPPIAGTNPNIREQEINRNWGLPSLNYYNEFIISTYKNFWWEQINCGVDFVRIDMAKHFALPYEGGCRFWTELKKMPIEAYGECILLPKFRIKDYENYCTAIVSDGETDYWDERAICFIESHDSYDSETLGKYSKNYSDEYRLQLLEKMTRCQPNTLYYERPNDNLIFSDELRRINYINR